MHQTIGKILPADGYFISKKNSLKQEQYQALYQLYQPIIGVVATAFYLTLHHLFQPNQKHTHHHLMQILNLPLDTIYQAREKCEAIGLLKTYRRDEENYTIYQYALNPPLTSRQFLKDDLLNQLLLHQIGNQKHTEIKEALSALIQESPPIGQEVTASFTDVFNHRGSINQTPEISESNEDNQAVPHVDNVAIDWKWIAKMLDDRMLPTKQILTNENVKLMTQMVALYQLTNTQLEKAIQWAISSDHELNRDEFKAACSDLIDVLPEQVHLINQREKVNINTDKQKSKKDRFIERMETISPKELLEDLSSGNQASQQDLKMIANVMDAQGLVPGVMNVLIHYVMLKTDMKLTRSYLEKIASHWSRKNVKTVHQAMTLAKSENTKYQQWDYKKKTNNSRFKKNQDIVPNWFEERKKNKPKQPKQSVESDQDIHEILKAFKNK